MNFIAAYQLSIGAKHIAIVKNIFAILILKELLFLQILICKSDHFFYCFKFIIG